MSDTDQLTSDTLNISNQQLNNDRSGADTSVPASGEAQPHSLSIETADTPDNPPPTQTGGKLVWKPGRGAVEKVDRLTGEIVHLCNG